MRRVAEVVVLAVAARPRGTRISTVFEGTVQLLWAELSLLHLAGEGVGVVA